MEYPGVAILTDEVGTQRAVVSYGRRVVDARVAQQRRVARQLEVDERQVRARLRLVEKTVLPARHVLHFQLQVQTERIRVRRRSGRIHQPRQRLRVTRLPLCSVIVSNTPAVSLTVNPFLPRVSQWGQLHRLKLTRSQHSPTHAGTIFCAS